MASLAQVVVKFLNLYYTSSDATPAGRVCFSHPKRDEKSHLTQVSLILLGNECHLNITCQGWKSRFPTWSSTRLRVGAAVFSESILSPGQSISWSSDYRKQAFLEASEVFFGVARLLLLQAEVWDMRQKETQGTQLCVISQVPIYQVTTLSSLHFSVLHVL